jgi:hypothetical protein
MSDLPYGAVMEFLAYRRLRADVRRLIPIATIPAPRPIAALRTLPCQLTLVTK